MEVIQKCIKAIGKYFIEDLNTLIPFLIASQEAEISRNYSPCHFMPQALLSNLSILINIILLHRDMTIQLEDSKAGERLRQGIQIAIGTIHILRQHL